MIKLKCLECGKELIREDKYLVCGSCFKKYPIIDGIPRFTKDDYTDSFSVQWKIYNQTMVDSKSGLDRTEHDFFERTGLSKEELKDKLVLDAGCGNGRYSEIVVKYGAKVVSVDMSNSVDQTYQNIGSNPNVSIIQADILNLPFFEKTFDIVFSLGVIHHTSNCHNAFIKLSKLVKNKGKIAVWVYSNDGIKFKIYNLISNFYRLFTTRMPQKLLYKLCYLSVPLYYIHKVPVIGYITRGIFITSIEDDVDMRVLNTFDWYSPKYQSKHTYKELEGWYKSEGINKTKRLPVPVSMIGAKEE